MEMPGLKADSFLLTLSNCALRKLSSSQAVALKSCLATASILFH